VSQSLGEGSQMHRLLDCDMFICSFEATALMV